MDEIKSFWEKSHTKNKARAVKDCNVVFDNWLAKYLDDIDKHSTILELGCGLGRNTQFIVDNGLKVIATDFSQNAVDFVKEFIPQAETLIADLNRPLPFADSQFQTVVADLCLHYFSDKKTREIVAEIKRVLMSNGYLLARVNSTDDIAHGAGQGEKLDENFYFVNGYNKRFFNTSEVEKYFGQIGQVRSSESIFTRYTDPNQKKVIEVCVQKD